MPPDDSSCLAPAAREMQSDLVSRISALQELVIKQTSRLEELRMDRQLLLEDNKLMKEQLQSMNNTISALRYHTNHTNHTDHTDNMYATFPVPVLRIMQICPCLDRLVGGAAGSTM